jgi:hypothetical protein
MPLKLESQEPFIAIIIMTLLCVSRGTSYSSMNSLIFCRIALVRVCLITLFLLTREKYSVECGEISLLLRTTPELWRKEVEKGPHSDDDLEMNSVSSAGNNNKINIYIVNFKIVITYFDSRNKL